MTDFSLRTDYLMAAAACMSTDGTRYYLNGVHVEPHKDGGVFMVATDGGVMAILYDRYGLAPRGAILSMDFKDKGLKSTARESGVRRLMFNDPGLDALLAGIPAGVIHNCPEYEPSMADGTGVDGYVTVREVDGTFPPFRRVIPKGDAVGPNAPYGWTLPLLDRLNKAGRILGQRRSAATFYQTAPGDPALVTITGCEDAAFVVMPCRADSAGKPEWLNG